jgi:hypothetical protein
MGDTRLLELESFSASFASSNISGKTVAALAPPCSRLENSAGIIRLIENSGGNDEADSFNALDATINTPK